MRDVWFIRHAESLANIGEATETPREIPLSPQGLRQADALAETFSDRPDLIVTSPFDRARRTAEPLIRRFADVPVVTLNVQEFTYLSITRSRGTNSAERKPWTAKYWASADPWYSDGDQAESLNEFFARVEAAVRELQAQNFGLAVVFTHELVLKALLWISLRLGSEISPETMKAFHNFMTSFKIPNTAILPVLLANNGELFFGTIDRAEERVNA
jgi:broad specificity phosphatase PhoE